MNFPFPPAAGLLALVPALTVTIPEIQGRAHTSPLAGLDVVTRGVVTTVGSNGFYLEDAGSDGDDATSDGVFVYTGTVPSVARGDDVEVSGGVAEFLPGGDASNLTVTEVHATATRILARGRPLPVPALVGGSGRVPPGDVVDDDALSTFDPSSDGLDFWESLEGMRVRLAGATVVGPSNAFGECWVVAARTATGQSARGALTATGHDANAERVQVDDALMPVALPALDVGDSTGDIVGVVSYRYGCYEVLPEEPIVPARADLPREVTPFAGDATHLTIATFNTHNLGPDDADRMPRIGDAIANRLGGPDIVALQEIEDDSGPVDDGVVGAASTLRALAVAIREAGGPDYDWREIAPGDGEDGGAPGSNIRVALLFDPGRVSFVDRADGLPGTGTEPVPTDSGLVLSRSPGRIAPDDAAWRGSRKPLAAELRFSDSTLFVVVCHFASQIGSTPDFGAVQPPFDPTALQRRSQAGAVGNFVDAMTGIDPGARLVVVGDFNDDWFAGALAPLESSAQLYDVMWLLPESERYTYLYQGSGHAYDRAFVSSPLIGRVQVDIVHIAAEFVAGDSDHDPVVTRIDLSRRSSVHEPTGPRVSVHPNPSAGDVTVRLGAGDPAAMTIDIYDVRGRRVRSLSATARGGEDTILWDGCDDRGVRLPAGLYIVRASDGMRTGVAKLVRLTGRAR